MARTRTSAQEGQDWGEYQGFDESYEGHHVILGFFSPEATLYLTDNGEVDSISGTGHAARFILFADNSHDVVSQSFTFFSHHVSGTYSFGNMVNALALN